MTTLGFVGLGMMGAPMVRRLAGAGTAPVLFDTDGGKAKALAAETGGRAAASLAELGAACDIVVTMLPNSSIVRSVVVGGEDDLCAGLKPGSIVIDMSSSDPLATRDLGADLAKRSILVLDAPVSGGVRKAVAGTLSIMLGGDDAAALDRAEPLLSPMGTVIRTGPLGSGHAAKALNNYVSAAGLAAAAEAVAIAERFGIDPNTLVDVLNASTGRNNSTENKLKQFIVSGKFNSGFSLALMAKDIRTADDLAHQLDVPAPLADEVAAQWDEALKMLGPSADHTEIGRYSTAKR